MPGHPVGPDHRDQRLALSADQALANAVRLLQMAEAETNLALMERLEKLADSWVQIAGILSEREKV